MVRYREPTSDEMRFVDKYLAKLRSVFAAWERNYEDECALLSFAFYEECYEPIMVTAAPYVVGNSLVKTAGFRWVMVRAGDSWHHGILHAALTEPIDLLTLENGEWYRPESDEEPPETGYITVASQDVIALAVQWKQIKGREAQLPRGSGMELEEQVARAWSFRDAASFD